MKTIERLRTYKPSEGPWRYEPIYWALRMAEKGGNTHVPEDLPEDAKYPAREDSEYIVAVCNALPALLAVVEAQAAEIAKWRAAAETMSDRRSAEDHAHRDEGKWDWTGETCTECSAWMAADDSRKDTDAARRALEGGE